VWIEEAAATASANSLLIGLFRVVQWTIVAPLARPVTPEVAASSPVALPSRFLPAQRQVVNALMVSGRDRRAPLVP
jgi:hypothetical protein